MTLLATAIAGALGTLARIGLSTWAQRLGHGGFPTGTLTVNLVGCFLMGLLAAALEHRMSSNPAMRLAIFGGFLGAFTTFSAFGFETQQLWRNGLALRAVLYVLLSVAVGLLAVRGGMLLGQRI